MNLWLESATPVGDPCGNPRKCTDWRQSAQGRNWAQILYHYKKADCTGNGTNNATRSRRIAKPIEGEGSIEQVTPLDKVMTNQKCSLNANRLDNSDCGTSSSGDLGVDSSGVGTSNCARTSSICRNISGSSQSTSHNFSAFYHIDSDDKCSEWPSCGRLIMSATERISPIAAKSVPEPVVARERAQSRWTLHRKSRRCKFAESYLLLGTHKQSTTDHFEQSRAKFPSDLELRSNRTAKINSEEDVRKLKAAKPERIIRNSDRIHQDMRPKLGRAPTWSERQSMKAMPKLSLICLTLLSLLLILKDGHSTARLAEASLIVGDSAIEIQEVDSQDATGNSAGNINSREAPQAQQQQNEQQNQVIFGSTNGLANSLDSQTSNAHQHILPSSQPRDQMKIAGPLPPLVREDITDGDKNSRNNHDFDLNELNLDERQAEKNVLNHVLSATPKGGQESLEDKTIAGKVVDFELTPAGGHNKAKIKKKKKKMAKQSMYKKWGHKKESEKKLHEKKHKESMKKKKEEGHKGKKKWGKEEHGLKKKGDFKKKKWGKKVKKGKGVKKGKKGKKFLKDVGHKNTGFKTVYHKEEWGKSSKWHDIKRQKKWDEKSKKWKKKWKKEKGKKYKGDHMKKFEKKKKSGKKYKKEKEDKFKKFKKEKFEKGKKKKLEEKAKKKESGAKKHMKKEMKKKKVKKHG